MASDTPQSWDRQPDEPNRWYQRFTSFRLQGTGRSIESTWKSDAIQSKAKRPNARWYEVVKLWNWHDRAAAWDQFLNDQKEAGFVSRHMGPNEVKAGLADIARGNLADLMEITTSGFTLQLMTEDAEGNKIVNPKTKLIKKIKKKVTTFLGKRKDDEDREIIEIEVEIYSAHDAYRDIGKIHGLFVDRSEVTVTKPVQFVETILPPEESEDVSDSDK